MDSPLFCVATAEDIIAFALNVAEAEESLENGMQWVRNNVVVIAHINEDVFPNASNTVTKNVVRYSRRGMEPNQEGPMCMQLAKKMVSCSSSRFTNSALGRKIGACMCVPVFFVLLSTPSTEGRFHPPPAAPRLPREMSDAEDSKDSYCRHILQIPMGERR